MSMTFEKAKALYVHRYTMEHVPNWALKPALNGKYYAPQYRTDREWYENTLFPPHKFSMGPRDTHCHTSGQTWPLGEWLDRPFKRG